MKSVKSCFNKALFFKNIKRFWPVWVLYNIAWLIGMPLVILGQLAAPYSEFIHGYVLGNALYMGVVMNAIFGFVSALTLFSYLYSARSVGAFHTLPVRREGLFLTCFLSGLCWLFVSNLFIFVLSAVVELIYGVLSIGYLLQWLAMVCLEGLFFYCFAVFCAFLTGHGFAHLFIYGILNFIVIIIEYIVRYCASLFCFGLSGGGTTVLDFLSPMYMLLRNTRTIGTYNIDPVHITYTGWSTLIIYAAVGIVFALIALLLYRRRQSESASEFIAVPALRPVFLYFFAFIGSLLIGMIFYLAIFGASEFAPEGAAWPMLVCMIAGGFIGYFITSMLLNKSFRVFKKTGLGFIVYAVILSAVVMAMEVDVFKVERYVPEIDSVESIRISGFSSAMDFDDPEVMSDIMQAHKAMFENKDANENYARSNRNSYYESVHVRLQYYLKNGKVVVRNYNLYNEPGVDENVIEFLQDRLNTPKAISDRMSGLLEADPGKVTSISINYAAPNEDPYREYSTEFLAGSKAREFFEECLKADIREGKFARVSVLNETVPEDLYYDCYIVVEFERNGVTLVPSVSSEKTMAYLKAMGIEPPISEDQYKMSYYTDWSY